MESMVHGTLQRSALQLPVPLLIHLRLMQVSVLRLLLHCDVTVTGAVTPTFDPVGNLCIGATAPVLPAVSNNGINGTWNPATISTAAAGTTTYTFTPDAGQCASSASIDITIAAQVTPVFTAIGPVCVGATAPDCLLLPTMESMVHGTLLLSALQLPVLLPIHLLLMPVSVLLPQLHLM
jgi:hypothetical protein